MAGHAKPTPTKKKFILYAGIVAVIAVAVYAHFNVWADLPVITGPPIPYNHLSSEETEPYLDKGKPPVNKADIRAAKKWPDVRSCLVRSERNKDIPDLRKIDWGKMRKDTDIEVCMFRIFTSLGTPEKAKIWFEAQGLQEPKVERYQGAGQQITRVKSYNLPRTTLQNYVPASGIFSLIYIILTHGEGFGVIWDEGGEILSAVYERTTL